MSLRIVAGEMGKNDKVQELAGMARFAGPAGLAIDGEHLELQKRLGMLLPNRR